MRKMIDLKSLFTVVAGLEFFYFLAGMLPPSLITSSTGWVLNADGHWITKILGLALLTQAYLAWIFRKNPPINVAIGLAFYQVASATMDWVMWLAMKEEGIFSNPLAKATVTVAIVTHYLLGILIFIALTKLQKNE